MIIEDSDGPGIAVETELAEYTANAQWVRDNRAPLLALGGDGSWLLYFMDTDGVVKSDHRPGWRVTDVRQAAANARIFLANVQRRAG